MFVPAARAAQGIREQRLFLLYVSLSNQCNARCVYCDVHRSPPPRPAAALDLERVLVQAGELGCETVHFMGGGEPLVAPGLDHALTVCARLDLAVSLTTNASVLARRAETVLDRVRLETVVVSLDSHRADAHDRLRGIAGLWRRALDGIAQIRVRQPRAKVVVNHVLTRDNLDHVADFVAAMAEAGAAAVNFIPVKDMPNLVPTPGQARQFLAGLERLRALGPELLCDGGDVASWAGGPAPGGGAYRCAFPLGALYVDVPTGGVFPCDCTIHRRPVETFRLGDIFGQSLGEIWTGPAIQALRATLLSAADPGCKADCDWNNRRVNRTTLVPKAEGDRPCRPI